MANASAIVKANREFSNQHSRDEVVASATSEIGARTLGRMFAAQRNMLDPVATIVYTEVDVSLISGVDLACKQIKAAETNVDYICMSMGGLPLAGARFTKKGLEVCFTVSYASRIRLLVNLLPFLSPSAQPRVPSVLNGDKGKHIGEHDLDLAKNWSVQGLVNHTTPFTSLAFNDIVESDNIRRRQPLVGVSFLRRIYIRAVRFLYKIMRYFTGISPKEAGER
ncbi:hypothetical protein F5Y04DRAFT_284180 [Hypomontagnella monticulosa]|nr:hypothetical protein F5Y04DRAFT_284180 [Hypomontagnella monticulosa]